MQIKKTKAKTKNLKKTEKTMKPLKKDKKQTTKNYKIHIKNIKKHLITHKKEIKRVLLIFVLLIVLYFSSTLIFQIRGNYVEQIIMETQPQYLQINMKQGLQEEIQIETQLTTQLFCRSQCEYQFIDLSNNKTLMQETFSFTNYKKFILDTNISTNKLGTGQELYLFQLKCQNQESRMCKKTEIPIMRTSLITLNYEPSEEQQLKREEILQLINKITNTLQTAQNNLQTSKIIINNMTYMKKNHLETEVLKIEILEEILNQNLELIDTAWQTQNYTYAYEEIKRYNLPEKTINFEENSNNLIIKIETEKQIHNQAIKTLQEYKENLNTLNELRKTFFITRIQSINIDLPQIQTQQLKIYELIHQQNFKEYKEIQPILQETKTKTNQLLQTYETNLNNTTNIFSEAIIVMSLLKNDLCLLNNNENCNQQIIQQEIQNLENINETQLKQKTKEICEEITILQEQKQTLIKIQEDKRLNLTEQQKQEIEDEKQKVEKSMIQWQIQNLNQNQTFEITKLTNYSNKINQTTQTSNYYPENYDEEKQEYFLPAKYLQEDTNYFLNTCNFLNYEFPEITKKEEPEFEIEIEIQNITLIQEISATCCFKTKCEPCCDYEECKTQQQKPLIVLHGYSFYGYNSALHSANAYGNFVEHALNDSKYLPAGIIGPSFFPEYESEDITRTFIPAVFKATYYEIVSFEQLNITTINIEGRTIEKHAENLHELIEQVKKATGHNQIDIVAHSMGGLVTRTYIDKYGDESLNKIILVGTPNKGVPASVVFLCKFFGGQKECDEMSEKSQFMNYLNNEARKPEKEIHIIIGTGCTSFGADGDGLVQTKSAELEYATNHYFTGSCELTDNFHRDMIKPSKYPEIYKKILEILQT